MATKYCEFTGMFEQVSIHEERRRNRETESRIVPSYLFFHSLYTSYQVHRLLLYIYHMPTTAVVTTAVPPCVPVFDVFFQT